MTVLYPNTTEVQFKTEYADWVGRVLATVPRRNGMIVCLCETDKGEMFVAPQSQLELVRVGFG